MQMHLAVAAQPRGAHRHRLDHGAEAADPRALRVDLGQAAAQQRHIRRRAADVADTSASASPVSQRAPTMLAAGPDRIVSIGRSRTIAAEISAPSPRTTIKGASIPIAARCRSQAATSRSIIPISRAFSTAVSARFGPFRLRRQLVANRSPAAPSPRRISSRAATSCAGLRVAKRAATAKPVT